MSASSIVSLTIVANISMLAVPACHSSMTGVSKCTLATVPGAAAPAAAYRRVVLVAAWTTCTSHDVDRDLASFLPRETCELANAFRQMDPNADVQILENPDRATFERALRSNDAPLFVVYSGHGAIIGGRSHLCFRDDTLPAETAITFPPPTTPYMTFLLNACTSAETHVRRPNAIVLAAAPTPVANRHVETVLGTKLLKAAREGLDGDGDGTVDSHELFRALDGIYIGPEPVALKFQSQAWTPLPLLRTRSGVRPSSTEEMQSSLEAKEKAYRDGTWMPSLDAPSLVWFIPRELEEAPSNGATPLGDRVASEEQARAIAATTLSVKVVGVTRERGSFVARDLRTGDILWERTARSPQDRVNAADRHQIVWGYEESEQGGNMWRRYLRPIPGDEAQSLRTAGWQPLHCSQNRGQCFTRAVHRATSR